MAGMATVKSFLYARRIALCSVLLVGLILASGLYGWKEYTYLQSSEFFVENLEKALQGRDVDALAALVDFRSLAEDFATHMAAILPMNNTDAQATHFVLVDGIQNYFMQALRAEEKPASTEEPNPLASLAPWPEDFITQLGGGIVLQNLSETEAVGRINITYPRLNKSFVLLLIMEKVGEWRVTRIGNAKDLLENYLLETNKIMALREEDKRKRSVGYEKRMKDQFSLLSCTAFAQTLSDQKTSLIRIRLEGYNNGPFTIRNMTFKTIITAHTEQGDITLVQDFPMAARVTAAIKLEETYTIPLDIKKAQDLAILQAKSITCTATPKSMTLDNGELLFVYEPPTKGK